MGYIYLITNIINGKKYVGQSKCEDIERRWSQHRSMLKSCLGKYLYAAYQKHGINNFKFQIICISFDEACDPLEEYYIQKFNTLAPHGYNLKPGGKSSKHTEETKKRISLGLTEEIRNRLREHAKNNLAFRYHKKYTQEEKEIIRQKQINYWKNLTNEEREKISKKRKEIRANILKMKKLSEKAKLELQKRSDLNKKSVGKYDLQNNLLETYQSISDAAREMKMTHSSISKVCLGKPSYKTAGGFIWKFM